ncbi:MAG: TAXI family TRAP transporter solute-binding subunit [Vicinamibacterales bacterium]
MPQRLAAILLCGWVAGGACACRPPAPVPASPKRIRLITGQPGGGFSPLGEQLAMALAGTIPGVEIETVPSSGAVSNVEALQAGSADLGLTFADVAYIAFSGQLTPASKPFERLRAMAVLQVTPVALVVRAGLPVRGPGDLRGRRIGLGPPGSGTVLTANLILRAYGLEPSAVQIETIDFQDAATRLLDGTLDAMFDNAINQSDSLRRAIDSGARLVPIEGVAVNRLRREYPFLKLTVISAAMYPGIATPVHTIGIDGVLICRSDLDERLVYNLTKQLFASLEGLSERGALSSMDIDQAPATPIPLHDGAARYYRERELSR